MSTNETLKRLLPAKPDYMPNPRKWTFWRDSFIYFWVFSFIGHLMEYPWIAAMNTFGQNLDFPPFFVIAIPYGFGVLAILWFIYPIFKKKKIGIIMSFILSALICTAIEFVCALIPFLIYGHNVFWDYSGEFMNLFGFVCFKNSIAFGLVSLAFLYIMFPVANKIMKNIGQNNLNKIFWVLFIGYIAVHLYDLVIHGSLLPV